MNAFDLNAYGVSEMNHQEMVETDGGGLISGLVIVACLVVAAVSATSCGSKGSHGTGNEGTVVRIEGDSNIVKVNTGK